MPRTPNTDPHQIDHRPAVGFGTCSRRSFLKLFGLAVASTVVEIPAVQAQRSMLPVIPPQFAHPDAILPGMQLVEQVVRDLQAQGFPFNLEQVNVVTLPEQPHLLGMLLHDTRIPPRSAGADIAVTFNLQQPQQTHLHVVIARSSHETLDISSTRLIGTGGQRHRFHHVPRDPARIHEGPLRYPSFHPTRSASSHPERTRHRYTTTPRQVSSRWYYDYGIASWVALPKNQFVLQFLTLQEHRDTRETTLRVPRWLSATHTASLGSYGQSMV